MKFDLKKTTKAWDLLSIGISMVVAIFIGGWLGKWMADFFGYRWLFFLGLFWGIAAAFLNMYRGVKRSND